MVAAFDGGRMTSDAGALLLGLTGRAVRLVDRFAGCFDDARDPALIEHEVRTLVGQRVIGIALGYEDLNDHDELRHDPVMAVLAGKLRPRLQKKCAPVAGKSTLNRLELSLPEPSRYKKISYQAEAIEALLVDIFLESHAHAPEEIVIDLDATDDPLHGMQEGRFFHGYYGNYCYLPLYVTCGEHLLASKLRRSNLDAAAGSVEEIERIVGQIRARWPTVRITLRADSGFAREEVMIWCELNGLDFLFGLARNVRLVEVIAAELKEAEAASQADQGRPARRFKDFTYRTRKSWRRSRRVVGKAEWTGGQANPRFVVTSLSKQAWPARSLYEDLYCARGDMENRIKECQLDLFADRTSATTFRANQLRLWFASLAYVLMCALRRALAGTHLERATCGSIRLKLLKIGALVTVSVRRIRFAMSSACPFQREWALAYARLSSQAA
ncbi:MAG TPA: IS1380 family transposase [Caulobacteraceae bacterium]